MNVEKRLQFLKETLTKTKKERIIIGISGGIDSAVTLKLVTMAIGEANTIAGIFPYEMNSFNDSRLVCQWAKIKPKNIFLKDIAPFVDAFGVKDEKRKGNIMARIRMIFLFDIANAKNGLVCGTENKSEKELGYFTRYGDAASDIEVINDLYKTDVKKLAIELQVPQKIIDKAPSAGLWDNQTDEGEFGFTYEQADEILKSEGTPVDSIKVDRITAEKIIQRINDNKFKQQVPYEFARWCNGNTSDSESENSRFKS